MTHDGADVMIKLGFVLPGSLEAPTGGTRYDREILERLPSFGIKPTALLLSAHYPEPELEDRISSARLIAQSDCDLFLIDGLAFGAFTEIEINAMTKPYMVLLHHPLADEKGLDEQKAAAFYHQEKANLRHAGAVIVTSQSTKERLKTVYDLSNEIITVAEPAVSKKDAMRAKSALTPDRAARLLSVGAISPRKNYALIINALAHLNTNQDWIWQIAGRLDDKQESSLLRELGQNLGLDHKIEWLGAVTEEQLTSLYQNSDFLLFPSYYEGYGMALDEALAHGLPVLASDKIPSACKPYQEAVKQLNPNRSEDWSEAIKLWLNESLEYQKACKAAYHVANSLPDWDQPAGLIAKSIRQYLATGKGSL
ncbi:MAG: glycosyltransferase [Methylocystaceae bacterium]|nr:glycosyltransferase [Methylocystaceae bacterium]